MPYLSIKTTRTLTLQQELALKESAGKLITLLPYYLTKWKKI